MTEETTKSQKRGRSCSTTNKTKKANKYKKLLNFYKRVSINANG